MAETGDFMDTKIVLFTILSCFISHGLFCGYDQPLNNKDTNSHNRQLKKNEKRELERLSQEEMQNEITRYITTNNKENVQLPDCEVTQLIFGIDSISPETRDETLNVTPYLSKILAIYQEIKENSKTPLTAIQSFKYIYVDCECNDEQWESLTKANIVDKNTVNRSLEKPYKKVLNISFLEKHKRLLTIVAIFGITAAFLLYKKNLFSFHLVGQPNLQKS